MSDNLDNFIQDLLAYAKHLPPEEKHPIEVLVLKWHLIIEEELRQIVRLKFVDDKAYDLKRTSFSTLLRLSHALYGNELLQWEWEVARQINTVRNSLAHSLDDETLIPRIEKRIFSAFESNDSTFSYSEINPLEKLSYCFAYIHTAILRVKHNDS